VVAPTPWSNSSPPNLFAAALDYANRGWPVVPLHTPLSGGGCSCRKRDCGSVGKHPRTEHGRKDATTDPEQLRRWWDKWPGANLGVVTGAESGLVVLDVDPRNGGNESLADLEARTPLPPTARTVTGSGGQHILFAHPGGHVGNSTGKVGAGLDVKADDGYIVAPPSLHASGRAYEWAAHPDHTPLASLPDWLRILTAVPPRSPGDGCNSVRLDTAAVLLGVPEGERDSTLFRLACKLRHADVPQVWAERLVLDAAANCTPPFPADAAREKVLRAYATYPAGAATMEAERLPTLVTALAAHTITFPRWPDPLAPEAFHGLVGEIVHAIEPYSEADPAALLAHLLTGFGALVGPNVYAMAGDAQHPARLNAVCVGVTSKARKGSAARPIERLLQMVDADFVPGRVKEGLSSGEGLIWQVRDPSGKARARRGKSGGLPAMAIGDDAAEDESAPADAGADDKRLWLIESEFASVLRMVEREGNTLSAIVRRAWDSGTLESLTKNSPAKGTNAHISIMGHVTKEELLRYLSRTELASGFANRFLWVASRRGQLLPDGEAVPEAVLAPLAAKLKDVQDWARARRQLRRDADASALWIGVYPSLSNGRPGMLGAATNRAEAQVLRLSVLYAVLECSDMIRAEHLKAALAVWRYADQTSLWLFGDALGDPVADTVLTALRQRGEMSRDDIVNLLQRHPGKARVDQALDLLRGLGLAQMERRQTGGRPREVWTAT
jgi:hypothetical protein